MSAAPSPEMVRAMRVAEWKAEAKLTGKTLAQVACAAARAIIQPCGPRADAVAAEVWFDLGDDLRLEALAHATDRKLTANSSRIRWDQLTDREKLKCGVFVRELHRKTVGGWALR